MDRLPFQPEDQDEVYADVFIVGKTLPSQEQILMAQRKGNRILFRNFWFERTPSLDTQMQKYALGTRQRYGGK